MGGGDSRLDDALAERGLNWQYSACRARPCIARWNGLVRERRRAVVATFALDGPEISCIAALVASHSSGSAISGSA